jgi:hypothetical protein
MVSPVRLQNNNKPSLLSRQKIGKEFPQKLNPCCSFTVEMWDKMEEIEKQYFRKKPTLQTTLSIQKPFTPVDTSATNCSLASPSTYLFSKPLNPLDYHPTYPKNPVTFTQYIRKYRKGKGLLVRANLLSG